MASIVEKLWTPQNLYLSSIKLYNQKPYKGIHMPDISSTEIKYLLLIFGVILLAIFLIRKAVKKVNKEREGKGAEKKVQAPVEKPKLTEQQFSKSWKNLSYLLLLAAAGNLYMVYTAVRNALLPSGVWVWWIDAVFSLLAAGAAVFIWRKKEKLWVYVYFIFTCIPVFLFMSIQGTNYKVSALIHLFPLVLLYFVLQPVWSNLKN